MLRRISIVKQLRFQNRRSTVTPISFFPSNMKLFNSKTGAERPQTEVKVVILGTEFTGKTCLIQRFLSERFVGENKYQNTIGAAYGAKKMVLDDRRSVLLGIWDTAGSER